MNTAVQPKPLLPDLAMAERYLTLLDETADSFVFQTFDDDKQRKDKHLAAKRIGSLSQHSQTLTRANHAGAGIFCTVNETDGKGRTLENITRIRTVWHEEDTPHTKQFPLEPNFSIESSPGKFHHYWLVDDLSKEDFAGVMECLIQVYGSDPNVKDTARVLRLPGFYHQKDPSKPFMVRIVHESGIRPYSREQILAAFPLMEKAHKPSAALPIVAPDGEATEGHKALALSLSAKAAAATHADHTKGRHSQVLWLGRECAHKGVPQAVGPYALKCFAKLMRQTDTTGQIAPLNFDAELKAFNDAYAKGLANPPEPSHWHGGDRREYGETSQPAHSAPPAVESIEAENQAKKEWEARIDGSEDFCELTVTFFTAIENSTLREPTKAALAKKIAAQAKISVASLKAGFQRDEPPLNETHPGTNQSRNTREKGNQPEWRRKMRVKTNEDGKETLLKVSDNLLVALTEHPDWEGVIGFDEFSQKVGVVREPPIFLNNGEWDDIAVLETHGWLERIWGCTLPLPSVESAIVRAAYRNPFHPVKDWLHSLQWNGKPRANMFFHKCMGADNNPYTRAASISLLCSAIARVENPGCQADTMIVLEGPQGIFKSSAILELFTQKWHAETTASDIGTDFYQCLRGKWCVDFGEMSIITKHETALIKSVLTRRADTYRASYARSPRDYLRQNIFIASTNEDEYLTDATGDRRTLPVKCGAIRLDWIKEDREQFFAEALHMYRENIQWWVVPDAKKEQDRRFRLDPWEESVAEELDCRSFITVRDLLVGRFKFIEKDITQRERMRIVNILKRLGWEYHKTDKDETRKSVKVYRRKIE